jgi:putative transposase
MQPALVIRSAIVLKPSTRLDFHQTLRRRKYRILFSPKRGRKPGPKGPSRELIDAIVDTKQRNPSWDYPRIAQQLALAFGVSIDKDIVRRVLATHCRPKPDSCGPSWLTFLGQMKDSLCSMDLFRCESATLRTHWILVVMDQCSRRIIGFGVNAGAVDGVALCRMFNHAIGGHRAMPRYISSDHDPLFLFERWRANLRILDVAEVKTVPYVPLSHPFVERLIGTIRKEYPDRIVLDARRSRRQAARVPELLQHASHAYFTGGTNARSGRERVAAARGSPFLPVATPLPGPLSDTDSCLILQRLSLAVTCNGLSEAASRDVSVLRFVTRAYRSARFTAIGCFSETRLLRFGRRHR